MQTSTQLKPTFRRDVQTRACYRARRGAEIASRLEVAAREAGSDAALVEAELMRRCADVSNVWTADDLHAAGGELYEGHGTLWSCSGRLCPSCMAARRRRMRARVREGLGRVKLQPGERWRLVTLTCPTLPGVRLLQVRELFNRAWCLFRKREWWTDPKQAGVRAGVKGEEFTLGDARLLEREGREWELERDGFNFHIHVLVCSRWVEWFRLGQEWTLCIEKAAREQGITLKFNTSHGRAVVDVRLVVDRKTKARGTISLDGAVEEVSKYITKSESWLQVSGAQLVEVASVKRWFRAVEQLGECRAPRVERGEAREVDPAVVAEILTRGFSWPRQQALIDTQPEQGAGDASGAAYLDTKNLSDGGGGILDRRIGPVKARAPSLRESARVMDRDCWRVGLEAHIERVQEWRRGRLRVRFPYAVFRSLGGARWFGRWADPAAA